VNRILKPAAFVIVAIYFVLDAAFSCVTTPLVNWLGRQRFFGKVRGWIVSLRPYSALALFAVPVIVLELVKSVAAYLMATGHFVFGLGTLIGGEIKLTVVERLFQLNRKKLLSISAFAWAYGHWRRIMDWIESSKVWQAVRRINARTMQGLRNLIGQLKVSQQLRRLSWQSYSSSGNEF
jgi:hypothetical protein